ncbi:MAG: DUF5996 family protein [Pseudomonadota bacterium]|nr:DUF5996 family protein [Pseudomonadota bacterium]
MANDWPDFDIERDSSTFALLHLASQMLGKLRVAHAPWANHGWHATLHPVAEGLAIEPIASSNGNFTLTLDLCRHAIVLRVADGERDVLPLDLGSVAALHKNLVAMLDSHGLPAKFHGKPNEIADVVPFAEDVVPREYRPDSADRLHAALARIVPIFERFRAGFQGKASPVHFFWGSFDLAVTRFSGRQAPPHPGGVPGLPDRITREAYSHEVSSAGFWPGGVTAAQPIFYSYAYPEPEGYRTAKVAPAAATFDETLGEYILPYEQVRRSAIPEIELMAFLQSSYDAAADLASWDRATLEREVAAP